MNQPGDEGDPEDRDSLPPVGTWDWNEELLAFGVLRREVDLVLELGIAVALTDPTKSREGLTHHDLCFQPDLVLNAVERLKLSPADQTPSREIAAALEGLRRHAILDADGEISDAALVLMVAAWALFHQERPEYPIMLGMFFASFRHVAQRSEALVSWYVRQLMAKVLKGTMKESSSARESLVLEYLEDTAAADLVYPRMMALLPPPEREAALRQSGYIRWESKKGVYASLAREPEYHDALAQALRDSLWYGERGRSADAAEALSLFRAISVADEALRRDIEIALTWPVRAWVIAILRLESSGFPEGDECMLAMAIDGPLKMAFVGPDVPSWFAGGDLWHENHPCGFIARRSFFDDYHPDRLPWPEGEEPAHVRFDAPRSRVASIPAANIRWYRAGGCTENTRRTLGQLIEIWPDGLRIETA